MTTFLMGLLACIIAAGFFLCIICTFCALILSGRISRQEDDDLSGIEGYRHSINSSSADRFLP